MQIKKDNLNILLEVFDHDIGKCSLAETVDIAKKSREKK